MKIFKRILIALTMGFIGVLVMVAVCLIAAFVNWVFTFFVPDPLVRAGIIIGLTGLVVAAISFFTDK